MVFGQSIMLIQIKKADGKAFPWTVRFLDKLSLVACRWGHATRCI